MLRRLSHLGRALSLFFRLFILRSLKVMFLPGSFPKGKPAPAPPVIKRLGRKVQIVAGALLIFLILLPNLLGLLGVDLVQHAHYAPYIMAGLFGIGILIVRGSWKDIPLLTREAKANDYCLCLICGYCLKGLPDEHRCPECGSTYDIEDVKRIWSEYVADRAARQIPW